MCFSRYRFLFNLEWNLEFNWIDKGFDNDDVV